MGTGIVPIGAGIAIPVLGWGLISVLVLELESWSGVGDSNRFEGLVQLIDLMKAHFLTSRSLQK